MYRIYYVKYYKVKSKHYNLKKKKRKKNRLRKIWNARVECMLHSHSASCEEGYTWIRNKIDSTGFWNYRINTVKWFAVVSNRVIIEIDHETNRETNGEKIFRGNRTVKGTNGLHVFLGQRWLKSGN